MHEVRDSFGTIWASLCPWCAAEVFPKLVPDLIPSAETLGTKPESIT